MSRFSVRDTGPADPATTRTSTPARHIGLIPEDIVAHALVILEEESRAWIKDHRLKTVIFDEADLRPQSEL